MNESREKLLRQRVIAAFDRATFQSFYALKPWRVVWTFTHIWMGIGLATGIGAWAWRAEAWPPKLLIPLLVFYIGSRINAIAVQIHEAAHNLLFAGRRVNDTFCNIFGSYWVLNDVESYRRVHLMHHTDLHLDSDPDRELYQLAKEAGRYQITKLVLQDLLWVTALRRILAYLKLEEKNRRPRQRAARLHFACKLGCQTLLISCAMLAFGWWEGLLFYFVFWLAPLFSVFPAIVRLRIVTEHFSPSLYSPENRPFISRTTRALPLEIYLFGCDMEYHFEHHLLPTLPHAQLARLHGELVKKGFFESLPPAEDYLSGGYLRFWRRLLTGSLPQLSAPISSPA